MTRFVISAAAVALALAASGAASAQDQTMRVRIGDLNVDSDAGAAAALARIRSAATSFCGGDGSRDLGVIVQQRACVQRMTWTAVGALHAPRVTALSGHSAPIVLAAAPR